MIRSHFSRGVSEQCDMQKAVSKGWCKKSRGVCSIYVAKTKALNSYVVSAQLICAFVFAYAKSRFSHDVAQVSFPLRKTPMQSTANLRTAKMTIFR